MIAQGVEMDRKLCIHTSSSINDSKYFSEEVLLFDGSEDVRKSMIISLTKISGPMSVAFPLPSEVDKYLTSKNKIRLVKLIKGKEFQQDTHFILFVITSLYLINVF